MENLMNNIVILLRGLGQSMTLFCLSLLLAVVLALPVTMGRISKKKWINLPVRLYLLIMRGTPLMLQLMVVYFGLSFLIPGFRWPEIGPLDNRMVAAIVAFTINYAAYFAEIYRGGIESMPVGQYEAGEVLGFTKSQTFFRIILPQMVKRVLPACGNEFMTMNKDTALAMVIAVNELIRRADSIANREVSMLPYLIAGIFYLIINAVIEQSFHFAEKKLSYYR